MCAPHFKSLLQASKFEVVSDTPKGHTSKFAPATRRRQRDGSPSRNPKPSQQPPLSRWDSSSSCRNSPIKPQKPKVETPPSVKRMYCPTPPHCTLHNVLKPVRRSSMDIGTGLDNLYSDNNAMDTSALLNNVLENFSLFKEDCEVFGDESDSGIISCHF